LAVLFALLSGISCFEVNVYGYYASSLAYNSPTLNWTSTQIGNFWQYSSPLDSYARVDYDGGAHSIGLFHQLEDAINGTFYFWNEHTKDCSIELLNFGREVCHQNGVPSELKFNNHAGAFMVPSQCQSTGVVGTYDKNLFLMD